MTLTVTADSQSNPTKLVVYSDNRKHAALPAITEEFTITVMAAGESKVYSGTRETSPAVPAWVDPISIKDSRGVVWKVVSDDGSTAVYIPA